MTDWACEADRSEGQEKNKKYILNCEGVSAPFYSSLQKARGVCRNGFPPDCKFDRSGEREVVPSVGGGHAVGGESAAL